VHKHKTFLQVIQFPAKLFWSLGMLLKGEISLLLLFIPLHQCKWLIKNICSIIKIINVYIFAHTISTTIFWILVSVPTNCNQKSNLKSIILASSCSCVSESVQYCLRITSYLEDIASSHEEMKWSGQVEYVHTVGHCSPGETLLLQH